MERAVLISSIRQIEEKVLDIKEYDRIYFGSEFCPKNMPGPLELEKIQRISVEFSIPVTLVTPVTNEASLSRVVSGIESAAVIREIDQIQVNDWGILYYLREKFRDRFRICLGRILARQRTGPRIEHVRDKIPGAYESSKNCHLDIEEFLTFLKEMGVGLIGIDGPLQGIAQDFPERVSPYMALYLYYPYVYVSATLRCTVSAVGSCSCADHYYRLKSAQMPVDLWTRGSAVFYENPGFTHNPAEPGFAGTIFQPEIPW